MQQQQQPYKPINTFTRPPSIAQVIVYLVSLLQIISSYVIIQHRIYNQTFRIVFIILYTILFSAKVVLTFMVSIADPSDKLMIMCKSQINAQNQRQIIAIKQSYPDYMFCRECICFVKPHSKHCKKCQRCVQIFDHHCIWLNNCIGSINYKQFLAMLWVVQLQMSMYIIGCIFLSSQRRYFDNNIHSWSSNGQEQLYYPYYQAILIWLMLSIVSIFWLLNLNLLILHMYLASNGLTTYDWLFPKSKNNGKIDIQIKNEDQINFKKNSTNIDNKNKRNRIQDDFQIHGNIQEDQQQQIDRFPYYKNDNQNQRANNHKNNKNKNNNSQPDSSQTQNNNKKQISKKSKIKKLQNNSNNNSHTNLQLINKNKYKQQQKQQQNNGLSLFGYSINMLSKNKNKSKSKININVNENGNANANMNRKNNKVFPQISDQDVNSNVKIDSRINKTGIKKHQKQFQHNITEDNLINNNSQYNKQHQINSQQIQQQQNKNNHSKIYDSNNNRNSKQHNKRSAQNVENSQNQVSINTNICVDRIINEHQNQVISNDNSQSCNFQKMKKLTKSAMLVNYNKNYEKDDKSNNKTILALPPMKSNKNKDSTNKNKKSNKIKQDNINTIGRSQSLQSMIAMVNYYDVSQPVKFGELKNKDKQKYKQNQLQY